MGILYMFMGFLLVASAMSLPYPSIGVVNVVFFLSFIYYWAIYRPLYVPIWMLFLTGAFVDLMTATPFGLNIVAFMSLRWVVVDQRRFLTSQPFVMLWLGFFVFVGMYSAMKLVVLWGAEATFSLPLNFIHSAFINAGVFPILYLIMNMIHKIMPSKAVQRRLKL